MRKNILTFLFLSICTGVFSQEIGDTILLEEIIVIPSPFSSFVYNDNAFGNLHWTANANKLEASPFLNESLLNSPSVHINDGTTNPIGQDIQIRGFHASPLYGLSQEIAVYADGVRQNDLLGDVVFWDLMPTFAMNQAQIFVGSQPLFGLNALGATINYTTKSGFTNPGGKAILSYGSFNRLNTILEYGNNKGAWAYYFGGNLWKEDGWRQFSSSEVVNTFGKLSYKKGNNNLALSLHYANSNLFGNGAFPIDLLQRSEQRNQVYTHPDQTKNKLININTHWEQRFNPQTKGRLIIGYKNIQTDIVNGDESPFQEVEEDGQTFLVLGDDDDDDDDEEEEEEDDDDDDALEFATDINGNSILATKENNEGIFNRNKVEQNSFVAAYSVTTKWSGEKISWEWQSGLSFRGGEAHYTAGGELGYIDETRAVISSGERVTNFDVDVITKVKNWHATTGLNALIGNNLAIQLSGAYNDSRLILEDQLGTALNGNHHFSNVSGALSAYYLIQKNWMLHGTLNTTTRNPTAVEVSCADPDAPCRLPNAFLADPPLETVRATTAQIGMSYQKNGLQLSTTFFNTRVTNDIYFISAGPFRGSGYFDNIGNTKRIGWENSLDWQLHQRLNIHFNYTWLNATFQDAFKIASPNHPNAIDGELEVEVGDRIALIPNHNFLGQVIYSPSDKLELEWTAVYNAAQFIRGDEGNELAPIQSYWRNDATLRYKWSEKWQVWLSAKNLTNNKYQTFGLLGEADEAEELLGEALTSNVFAGPAAPRYLEIGLNLNF